MSVELCTLTDPDWKQCCCNCQFHMPVTHHCGVSPREVKELAGGCCCRVQKGWACVPPGAGRVFDNWNEHSIGCELYTAKLPSEAISENNAN